MMRVTFVTLISLTIISEIVNSLQDHVLSQDEVKAKYLKYSDIPISIDDESYYYYRNLNEENCDRYKCFSPLHCEINTFKQLTYYVYPPLTFIDIDDNLLYSSRSMVTPKYRQVLHSIITSSRFTLDPNKACIFIPSIDVSWFGYNNHSLLASILEKLPYWRFVDGRAGTNHMIISLDLEQDLILLRKTIGNSILVASNHDTWTFRPDFDYAVLLMSKLESNEKKIPKWKVIFTQYSSLSLGQQQSIDRLSSAMGDDILVTGHECSDMIKSSKEENSTKCIEYSAKNSVRTAEKMSCRCSMSSRQEYSFPQLLSSGLFCLILDVDSDSPLGDSGHYLINQSILRDCIPIVTNDLKLPYESTNSWKELAIRLTNVETLESILKLISINDSNVYENTIRKVQDFKLNHLQSIRQMVDNVFLYYDTFMYSKIFFSSSVCNKPLTLES